MSLALKAITSLCKGLQAYLSWCVAAGKTPHTVNVRLVQTCPNLPVSSKNSFDVFVDRCQYRHSQLHRLAHITVKNCYALRHNPAMRSAVAR